MTTLAEPGAPPPLPAAGDVPEGWEGILAPGERILWQGRPDAAPDWGLLVDVRSLFGLFFTGFALFWIAMASSMLWGDGGSGGPPLFFRLLFPLFGVPFVLVGLGVIFAPLTADLAHRRGAFYTLTDRAAFIATERRGLRKLDRYPLDETFRPVLEDADPGTVWFGQTMVASGAGTWQGRGAARRYSAGTTMQRVGFRRIRDARTAYGHMIAAQRALAAAGGTDDRPA